VAAVVTPTTARTCRRRHRTGTVTSRNAGSIAHEVVDDGCASDSASAPVMFMYMRNAPAAVIRPAST
jgi:hypothetical protein